MRTLFCIGIFTFLFTSCKKETPSILDNYQGDYHLTYTELEDSDFIVPTEMENDFGLTITSANKIKTYVNGKLLGIYKYHSKHLYQEEVTFSSFDFSRCNAGKSYSYELRLFSDGHIEFFNFPVEFKKNVFHP